MTFLSGLFLAALPLVAVPVLIHMYRGRQREVIAWGAMQFLAQAVTKGRRMERLEELLLMALRVGAIVAVVLALARPMIRSRWWGAGGATEVVLVVDNSLSMARTRDDFSAWDQLQEEVRQVIDPLTSGDEVHILLAAGHGQWLTAEGIVADRFGKDRIVALLGNAKPTLGSADLLDCLLKVVPMETEGTPRLRRIIAFTDNQAENWRTDAPSVWKQLGAARRDAAVPTSIQVIESGLKEAKLDNLAVMQLEASRKMARPGESIDFSAQVANVGQIASEPLQVEWLVEGDVVATTQLESLEPNQSARLTTPLQLDEPGIFAIACRVEGADEIALDQQGTVVVEVSDQIPILLVHDSSAGEAVQTADRLFATALGYVDGQVQPWHSVYRPKLIPSAALSSTVLSDYRGVVITSLAELDTETVEHLRNFVNSGGGLWVALGDQIPRESFNRNWYDDGNGLSPVAVEKLNTLSETQEEAGRIHPPSREHPATLQLADTTQLDIDEAKIYQHWQLATGDAERNVSVLLESGNGSPLVVENYLGGGRVLVQAFPLGLEWTNLPQLKSYVVMVHDWLDYLTVGATARYNLSPGSSILAATPQGTLAASAVLIAPDGTETSLVSHGVEGVSMLRYSQTQLPGLYRVIFRSGDETIASIPYYVARDVEESRLQVLDETQRAELFAAAELQFGAEGTQAMEPAEVVPRKRPVWGFLLLALLAFLAGELLLSNWLARQRDGVAVRTV